jgi:ankyrin repeat protein
MDLIIQHPQLRTPRCGELAATFGNLKIIKLLHSHSVNFTAQVLYNACKYGYIDIVKYYIDNEKPCNDVLCTALVFCCDIDIDAEEYIQINREIAEYLISLGADPDRLTPLQREKYKL